MNKLLLIIILSLLTSSAQSKLRIGNDSVSKDSLNQKEISESKLQSKVDSLTKVRIQKEMLLVSHDRKKTKQLESQLRLFNSVDSIRKIEMQTEIDSIRAYSTGIPIVPFQDTLFVVYTKIGSFKAEERATIIENRIRNIYNEPFFNPDSLKLNKSDLGTEIIYNNDKIVMVVTNLEAQILKVNDSQLATEYLEKIKASIEKERNERSFTNWLVRIGMVLLIFAFVGLFIFVINRLFRWLNKFFESKKEKFLNGFSINKVKIFSAEHFELFVVRLSNILRIFAIIAIIYLSLPLLFSLFPETKTLTDTLIGWILSPAKNAFTEIIGFLPNLFSIIVIVIIFSYTIKGIKYFVKQIENGEIQIDGFHKDWAQPTFRILKFLLYAFMLVLVIPLLPGFGSSAFQGVSVFIGVLFSLGSSSAIANIVAGLVITYMRQFKIGDSVKIGDVTGEVIEKTMLVTRIRSVKNEDVTVPNSTVLLNNTINYSTNTHAKGSGLIIYSTVTIGYDAPWEKVHQALIDAALRTDLILKNPKPFVLQTSLDDFYVSYQINAYTKEALRRAIVYSKLHQNIQDCFNEAGIEIMSPHYRGQRDGNMTTIPSEYLDKNYQAPSFKVTQSKND